MHTSKRILFPFLSILILIFISGCPFNNPNPMGMIGKDPVDGGLKGVWVCQMNDYPVTRIEIEKGKKKSLTGKILEGAPEIMEGITSFKGYTHTLEGKDFAYFKDASDDNAPYYYVNYRLDGDKLFTRIVRAESLEGAKLDTWGDIRFEFTQRIRNRATDFLDVEIAWQAK